MLHFVFSDNKVLKDWVYYKLTGVNKTQVSQGTCVLPV